MIKAHELRIGNLVKDRGGKIIRIDFFENESRPNIIKFGQRVYLGETEVHGLTEYSDFAEPIPITEELLIKAGFKVLESSVYKQFYIGINPVTKDWLFDLAWLEKPELIGAPNVPFYRNGYHAIHFVHQLQNLYFALTGEELIFEGLN